MGKYEPLSKHFAQLGADVWDATFADIERILQFPLPPSARDHRAWWSNNAQSHSQARSWIDAGWEARDIDPRAERVRFERTTRAGRAQRTDDLDRLWQQAAGMSGISDRAELEKTAVLALIQREAGKRLIALGGTMPEASAPARERPFA